MNTTNILFNVNICCCSTCDRSHNNTAALQATQISEITNVNSTHGVPASVYMCDGGLSYRHRFQKDMLCSFANVAFALNLKPEFDTEIHFRSNSKLIM